MSPAGSWRSAGGVAVLDVVAGDGIVDGLGAVRDGGRWVVAGALGGYAVDLDIRRLHLHNIAPVGSSMHTPEHLSLLADIARASPVRPVIAGTYALEDAARAPEDLATRHHVGKLVLSPPGVSEHRTVSTRFPPH